MRQKQRQSSVARGVLTLTLASICVKVIGLFYKIPLTYVLGDEGMGYFNAAYTIYAWLYMLSTAGFPVAVSIMVSEARARGQGEVVKRTLKLTGAVLVALGLLTTAFMMGFARQIALLLGTGDAYYTILAISPTLLLICISSLFRGCFQGYENMMPTALSQLIEAVGKVAVGMTLATYALRRGYSLPVISAFAVAGVTLGTLISTIFLALRFLFAKYRGELKVNSVGEVEGLTDGRRDILKRLLAIALPVTVSSSVMSLTGLIDLGVMIRRLVFAGYTEAQATALYGNYTTLVVPMFNLPSVLISPIAAGIIPALSVAVSQKNREKAKSLMDGAFRTTALIALPAMLGMAVFSKPILALLYPPESVEGAYALLTLVSPAIYFVCLLSVSSAVLQATGHARVPMVAMLMGGIGKVAIGYILLGDPGVGIFGAPVGTVLCYVVALFVNLGVLVGRVKYLPPVGHLVWRPLLASCVGIGSAAWLYFYFLAPLMPRAGTLVAVGIAMVFYLLISYGIGSVSQEDFRQIQVFRTRKRVESRG